MKKSNKLLLNSVLCASILLTFSNCKKDAITEIAENSASSTNKEIAKTSAFPNRSGGIMMQAFYWDVPAGGNWYNTVKSKISSWSSMGLTALWLPPVQKSGAGANSMGYDPLDYFDLGDFNQNGTLETRFGSKTELTSLISSAHTNNMQVYADLVLNHNGGGASEWNTYTNSFTNTKFNVTSGKFTRSLHDFHPNWVHTNDIGAFSTFPDLCHDNDWVKDWFWRRTDAVSKYYKNTIGFDGWRLDYVKGFTPNVASSFVNSVGGFSVGENWDSDVNVIKTWIDGTGGVCSAFDFPCYYKMDEAFDGGDLTKLNSDMLHKRDPFHAVTFVTNHDTDNIGNKLLAYAYILTHEGYPCIFYRDYEEWLDKGKLNNLFWIHSNLAAGNTSILYTDNDEYIAKRNGTPGLIVYINNSDQWQQKWVTANYANTAIKDYTGNSNWNPITQSDSRVLIQAPPHGYTVWSVLGY